MSEQLEPALVAQPPSATALAHPVADSPWMPPAVAAAYLSISLKTLRNWTSARYIPFAKRGRIVRYHRAEIDRWIARGSCAGRSKFAVG